MGFQTTVKEQPAPGVEGDFAGNNPRASALPPVAGAYSVAAGQSVRVGFFAWGAANGLVYSSAAAAAAITGGVTAVGFVARQPNEPSAMITAFLGESIMTLQAGTPVTLMEAGDFWAAFAAGAAANVAVFATAATGEPTTTAGGNTATPFRTAQAVPVNAVTAATTTIALNTGIMTIATVSSGVVVVGQRVTGTGTSPNTFITAQLTGTPGGAGTYQTNSINRAAVAAFAATMIQGTLAKITSWF